MSTNSDMSGDGPLTVDASYYRELTRWGMGLTILSWLLIAGLVIYIVVKYLESDPIKDITEDSLYSHVTFNSLLVEGNTTLGNENVDDIVMHAEVSTSIVPFTDSQYSLGENRYKWDELHTDNIYYGDGTSVVSTSTGIVSVTDGFGYQMQVKRIASGTSIGLTEKESGYLLVVEDDPSRIDGGTIKLPVATGSGVYYDFLCATNVGISGSPSFIVQTEGDIIQGSMAVVVENSGPGDQDLSTIFTPDLLGRTITAGSSYPVSYGQRGILAGSEFTIIDYKDGVWLVDGTMIVASGLSVGDMTTPIIY